MLFDSHAHLGDKRFQSDLEEVISRAKENGVTRILNVGYDLEASRTSVQLAEKYDNIYAAVGIHPHDADSVTQETLAQLRDLAKREKVLALGEMGLDYYRNLSPKNVQQQVFSQQINLAKELKMPIIVHDRDAHQDTIDMLKKEGADQVGGILHCFSGSWQMAKQCLELGFYISLAGPVTFKNAHRPQEIAKMVPVNRLLVETDCPYLAPEPKRGKRNEPGYVCYIAEKIAEIKHISLAELAFITYNNTNTILGLD
ncbi:TatD family hydrolase [Metallumcola ferriviriculae]|uniref:TatD family hydrolase n=1 Tax=Metallumcola ferriviriculae TaxID=3039180 RepID=A0AAU0UJF2_9FIRM|nr:TatD family hydrolase [Desulfitibacteraceae bacterium MK1]